MDKLIQKAVDYLTAQIDSETALMLVEEAKESFPGIYDKYKESVEHKDLKQAKEDIHALKGVMGAIGLQDEVAIVVKIESKLLDDSLDEEFTAADKELSNIIDVFRS